VDPESSEEEGENSCSGSGLVRHCTLPLRY
jgi:hypothetical protein